MKKTKYIFVGMTSGFGPLAQIIPIVNELKKNGYKIICFIERNGKNILTNMGIEILDFPEIPLPDNVYPSGPEWWNLDYFWGKYGFNDYSYLELLIQTFSAEIEKYKPELIISVLHPPAAILARKFGVPLVCVTQSCMHKNGKGGRTTWWKELPDVPLTASANVNRILEEMGLEKIEKMEDLNEGDLTIVPSIPEFDVIDQKNLFYTGPMLWEGCNEIPEEEYKIERKNPYLIYTYTGYLQRSHGKASGLMVLENIVHAFKNTEFDVIVSIGVGETIPPEIPLVDNIRIVEWVPVSKVIPHCDLTLHHGGHGSCMQSLVNGVPSIVIPTSDEREYNARQMSELGVGVYFVPEEITPQLLLQGARELVRDEKIKNSAKSWSEKIHSRKYNGAVLAAQAIMDLMKA